MCMKKILFVSHEYNVGGSSVSLLSLIAGIKNSPNQDIKVDVLLPFCFKKYKAARNLFIKHNINCKEMLYRYNFKPINKKRTYINYLHDIWNFLAVARVYIFIKKEHYDIICSNSTGVDVGARAANLAHIPHIYYVREFMEKDHGMEYRNKNRMRKLLEKSEYCIFISKAIQKYYISNYKLKSTVQFYDGFITDDYYIDRHKILCNSDISFVQVGAFTDGKGTLNTIMLFHKLKERGIDNWTLEFVGAGREEYVSRMKELIEEYHLENQIIIGEFTIDIKNKLAAKDVLIMNSRAEGFGRVTVEGMLAGCLVMGRNAGGTTEIISHMQNGVLFQNDNDIIAVIKDIVNNVERYRAIANNGQKFAMNELRCENVAQKFLDFIK